VKAIERKHSCVIPWVFVHADGRAIKDFRGAWAKACEAAGVPGRLVHDFRRTAVRNLERAGVPRSAAMKLTGHKTDLSTLRDHRFCYAAGGGGETRGFTRIASEETKFSQS
jgi:integrase